MPYRHTKLLRIRSKPQALKQSTFTTNKAGNIHARNLAMVRP